MAIIGFPYNSQNRDRAIKAEVYRRLLSKYFTTGVFPNPSTQCQVVAGGAMNVTVKKGSANINGLYIELEEDVTVAVNAPDTLDRYDRIVLRNDDNTTVRAPSVVVIKGTPSESPQPPALTRNDTVYDICLATVKISQMDSKVEDYNIEDTRSNTDLCGIVSATIQSIDTTTFYNQIQADLKSFKENEQADFQEWFDTIKGILGKDEAGKLLQMVQENTSRITTNESDIEELTQSIDNVGTKLNSEISRATQKENELSSRMDTFTKLEQGSTTGDAELTDIRVGFDGKTYENAGSAVRGQVSQLSSDIVNVCVHNRVVKPVENEGYLNSDGNIQTENKEFVYTNPIEIKQGETIKVTGYTIDKNVCVIADYNNGEYSTPHVISDYTGDKTYEWTATKDTQVCACYQPNRYNFITITNKIVNELESLELIPTGMYIGNLDFAIKGYINPDGTMTENDFYLCTDFVPICTGATLKGTFRPILGNLAVYYFYDSDKKPLYGYTGTPIDGVYDYEEVVEKITDDNIKYVRCSYLAKDKCYGQITFSQIDYTDIRTEPLEKDFYVGYGNDDGKRYFSSLVDCLWVVSKTDGKKVVHIANGTYDVLEELGGMSYVNSKNTTDNKWTEVQPVVNDCKIVGYGNVVLTFNLDDSVLPENYWLFSCLNVRGNIEVENIEIHSSNCRYAIHDESGFDFPNSKHIYKNVRLYQNVSVGSKGGQTLGCGFSENAKVYINNCHFENGINSESWSCHANNGCSFVFDNTIFKSTENTGGPHSVRISQNGRTNLNARISNCYIHSGLSIRNEWTDASIEDTTKIELINTKIGNLINGYETIKEPVVSYNTIDGTITTLLDVTN